MKNKLNISIGIPAHNEAGNIKKLLHSLLSQKEEGFVLHEIIVVLDGCTDATIKNAKSLKDKRIKIVDDHKRLGKSARMNQMFKTFTGDVLFLFDADIIINDIQLLAKTMQKSNLKKDGISAINATPLPANTYFEHVLEIGVKVMKDVSKNWNNGDNYLSIKGCSLALDGKFARSLRLHPNLVSNDAYLYFAAKQQGYTPKYLQDVYVYFKSPTAFSDHLNQSSRHQSSREEIQAYMKEDLEKDYKIPALLLFKSAIHQLFLTPHYFLAYIGVQIMTKIKKEKNIPSTWNLATTTK